MQKLVHDIATGRVDVLEMTAQEEADLIAKKAAHQAAKEAEAAKPTPQKTLLAAAQGAKDFAELQAVVVTLIELTFSLGAVVDERPAEVIQTPQPVEEQP